MKGENQILELYSDYLLAQNHQATATGLSRMTNGRISHDQVTRFLSENHFDSKDLWGYVKSAVMQKKKSKKGVLILDDTIEEKPYTRENKAVCWHYDHAKKTNDQRYQHLNMYV